MQNKPKTIPADKLKQDDTLIKGKKMYYDVAYSEDDGYWHVESYSKNGKDLPLDKLDKNEFPTNLHARRAMTKHYPEAELINIIT